MPNLKSNLSEIIRKYGIWIVLVLMIVASTIANPIFINLQNIINVIRQVSVVIIISCGMQMLIITGNVDLSVGSMVALTGCVAVGMFKLTGSFVIAIGAALLIGIIMGFINGFITTKWNLPSFIVTLAAMQIARGGALLYTSGKPIFDIGRISYIGQGTIARLPIPVIIAAFFFLITYLILKWTRYGRYLYAIGCNMEASKAAGINVKRIIIIDFMVMGMLTAIAGVVFMSRVNSGQPASGVGLEFDAIIAVVLGGTSFTGGIGNIPGTIAGSIIIGILNNILNLIGVEPYYQSVSKGIIILAAVIIDANTKRVRFKTITE